NGNSCHDDIWLGSSCCTKVCHADTVIDVHRTEPELCNKHNHCQDDHSIPDIVPATDISLKNLLAKISALAPASFALPENNQQVYKYIKFGNIYNSFHLPLRSIILLS
ncbi:MAG: hypothetical protein JXM68_07095, partial [Sedimentisphaerales bacterium]|nr:hypothetical protein [Sedimentisphaerales bacterium]